MHRRLTISGLVLLFLTATLTVVWAGLNWPPPLWIVEYGLPPSQKPTGRVFHVEGVDFVEISPGYFRMGSDYLLRHPGAWHWYAISPRPTPGDLLGRLSTPLGVAWGRPLVLSPEMPVHWVRFARAFAIARTEVTNKQYERFDPRHILNPIYRRPCNFRGDEIPLTFISPAKVGAYCAWLSRRSGRTVRLPTEAEWECACRAGSTSRYCYGDDPARLKEYAWFGQPVDVLSGPLPVATLRPNVWGLYDMHGNVMEICRDLWHADYAGAPTDGSAWTASSPRLAGQHYHVQRSAEYADEPWMCRSAVRLPSNFRFRRTGPLGPIPFRPDTGFRLVISPAHRPALRPRRGSRRLSR